MSRLTAKEFREIPRRNRVKDLEADLMADYANELRGELSALKETNVLQARLIEAQTYILKMHGVMEEHGGS